MICQCPAAASIASVPAVTCGESFGQIQKVAFTRLRKANGSKNSFTSDASILLKASWTPKLTADDDTKIVVSPYIEAPTSEPGGPRTFGGGNETLGGIEIVIGSEPTAFSAVLRRVPQDIIKALKTLQCEAAMNNLGVFLFNEHGQMEAIADPQEEGTYYPIPIQSLFVSDKGHGGFENPDVNNIQWSFAPNYSDNLKILTPTDFNPLTDLTA